MSDYAQRKKDAAIRLTIKSLETGSSKYANEALKVGDLKGAYEKLGVLDRVILNLGLQDLRSQGKPTADPKTAYTAGQTYLHEYFSRELIETRTRRGELALKEKPLFRDVDLSGKLLGPSFSQGKRDWTLDEATAIGAMSYQLGILAMSRDKSAGGTGGDLFNDRVKEAKNRLDTIQDTLTKRFLLKPGQQIDEATAEKIWKETVKMYNSPSASTFRDDWNLWYNYQQILKGANPDAELRMRDLTAFPKKGAFSRVLRLIFPTFGVGPSYQTPPSDVSVPQTGAQAASQAEMDRALEMGRAAAGR